MGLVYSSRDGAMCPRCERPKAGCVCARVSQAAAEAKAESRDGIVRVGRETKGRKGAGVTVVHGVPLGAKELAELAKALKKRCGTGGTVRDGVIELQGEQRDQVMAELERRGYAVRRSGG